MNSKVPRTFEAFICKACIAWTSWHSVGRGILLPKITFTKLLKGDVIDGKLKMKLSTSLKQRDTIWSIILDMEKNSSPIP
jgi:hypothetical protein